VPNVAGAPCVPTFLGPLAEVWQIGASHRKCPWHSTFATPSPAYHSFPPSSLHHLTLVILAHPNYHNYYCLSSSLDHFCEPRFQTIGREASWHKWVLIPAQPTELESIHSTHCTARKLLACSPTRVFNFLHTHLLWLKYSTSLHNIYHWLRSWFFLLSTNQEVYGQFIRNPKVLNGSTHA
jgi:hypothetical protein